MKRNIRSISGKNHIRPWMRSCRIRYLPLYKINDLPAYNISNLPLGLKLDTCVGGPSCWAVQTSGGKVLKKLSESENMKALILSMQNTINLLHLCAFVMATVVTAPVVYCKIQQDCDGSVFNVGRFLWEHSLDMAWDSGSLLGPCWSLPNPGSKRWRIWKFVQ